MTRAPETSDRIQADSIIVTTSLLHAFFAFIDVTADFVFELVPKCTFAFVFSRVVDADGVLETGAYSLVDEALVRVDAFSERVAFVSGEAVAVVEGESVFFVLIGGDFAVFIDFLWFFCRF